MAVEWRSVCGVMFRPRREVQSRWAIATARSSRSRTPECDIAVPSGRPRSKQRYSRRQRIEWWEGLALAVS